MCKVNVNELKAMVDTMAKAVQSEDTTKRKVVEQLRIKASELRSMADCLVLLANNLENGVSDAEPVTRKTLTLKEGERYTKASKKGRKSTRKKPKAIPDDELTPEQLAVRNKRRENCKMMQERKKQKALVEHFAETKIC